MLRHFRHYRHELLTVSTGESIILNKDEEDCWMTDGNMGMLPIRIILEIYQYAMEHPEL